MNITTTVTLPVIHDGDDGPAIRLERNQDGSVTVTMQDWNGNTANIRLPHGSERALKIFGHALLMAREVLNRPDDCWEITPTQSTCLLELSKLAEDAL